MQPFREEMRYEYDLTKDSVVMDVGGFEGDFAAGINERYGCRILVYEPVREFFERIERRFADVHNIKVFQYGLLDGRTPDKIKVCGDATTLFTPTIPVVREESVTCVDIVEELYRLQLSNVDLIKINIEGGEFPLLTALFDSGYVNRFDNIQVQFHRNVVFDHEFYTDELSETHRPTYSYPFIWDNWKRK